MTVKVYQIDPDAAEAMYPESSFEYGHGNFDPVKHLDKYIHVADLVVDTLDEAFEVGNVGPGHLYIRYEPMHSVSVGDILELDGQKYVVAPFGFDEL